MAADHDGKRWGPWAALVFAVVGTACIRHDDLKVRVFNDGPAGVDLQDVHVFGGAEKAWWSTVAGGTSVGTLLRPRGEPELSMTFARAGGAVSWQGPALTTGNGYTVHIHVDANGAVTEQHCLMPCMLP
jgi:hypothetical protein